jgi:nicotinamidase-related amidase
MDAVDPARSLLLVMDFQPGVLGRVADVDALLARARRAIDAARAADLRVGYVRVGLTEEEAADVAPHNRIFAGYAARSRSADPAASQVDERLGALPSEPQFRKRRVGALSTTDLDDWARSRGIDTLLLSGVSTSGVVLSTVRDAADRDYRVIVVEDASADFDEEVHRVLTGKVFPRQAEVVTVEELVTELS